MRVNIQFQFCIIYRVRDMQYFVVQQPFLQSMYILYIFVNIKYKQPAPTMLLLFWAVMQFYVTHIEQNSNLIFDLIKEIV